MIPRSLPASVKEQINKIRSPSKKQQVDETTPPNIPEIIADQSDFIKQLLYNHMSLINQMFTNQSKTQTAEQKSYEKKIDDKINNIKIDYNVINQQLQTYIYEKDSHYVRSALNILNLDGSGTIEEILIKSQSNDFTIVINIDDMPEYQRTWKELNEISEDLDGVVAVNRSSTYIVKLSNIHFKHNIKMMISTGGITLDKIYVRCSYGRF